MIFKGKEMKTLETLLLGVGFFALVPYLLRRAFIGNKNILLTGKFSLKDEFRAAGKSCRQSCCS